MYFSDCKQVSIVNKRQTVDRGKVNSVVTDLPRVKHPEGGILHSKVVGVLVVSLRV